MCELLVGLPAVVVLGVEDDGDGPLRVQVETRELRPACPGCAGVVVIKDRPSVELVDLPCFGRPAPVGVAQAAVVVSRHDVRDAVVDRGDA